MKYIYEPQISQLWAAEKDVGKGERRDKGGKERLRERQDISAVSAFDCAHKS